MNLKMTKKLLRFAVAALTLASCATPRSMSILLDMAENQIYPAPPAPELVLHREDQLGIQVLSENPQLAAPFNAGLGLSDAQASNSGVIYTIDTKGNIDFPVLGTLHVEGMTLKQVKEQITASIREKGYIKAPIVRVTLENFTVTVIGNLGNSVLKVENPSINLLQVLARSEKISSASNIKDITVIRTSGNERKAYAVNLQTTELFNSPVFYLQQNDVVYVKPRGATLSPEGQVTMTFVGTGLTLASIITNVLIWTRR